MKRRRTTVLSDKVSLVALAVPGVKAKEAESCWGRLRAREKDWDTVAPTVARTMPAAACQHHTPSDHDGHATPDQRQLA